MKIVHYLIKMDNLMSSLSFSVLVVLHENPHECDKNKKRNE